MKWPVAHNCLCLQYTICRELGALCNIEGNPEGLIVFPHDHHQHSEQAHQYVLFPGGKSKRVKEYRDALY